MVDALGASSVHVCVTFASRSSLEFVFVFHFGCAHISRHNINTTTTPRRGYTHTRISCLGAECCSCALASTPLNLCWSFKVQVPSHAAANVTERPNLKVLCQGTNARSLGLGVCVLVFLCEWIFMRSKASNDTHRKHSANCYARIKCNYDGD